VQHLRYSRYYDEVVAPLPPTDKNYPDQNELKALTTKEAWFQYVHASVGRPWLAAGTKEKVVEFAKDAVANTDEARRRRLYAMQALILGGPDGQVM
jgi:hypothetical protein